MNGIWNPRTADKIKLMLSNAFFHEIVGHELTSRLSKCCQGRPSRPYNPPQTSFQFEIPESGFVAKDYFWGDNGCLAYQYNGEGSDVG